MSKEQKKTEAPTPQKAETVDYVAGIRKVAPNEYRVVTAKLVDGKVTELKIASEPQELRFTALELRTILARMVEVMP